jgi:hypothetical protein
LRNIIGHSILGFGCQDGTKVFLSIEGEQEQGKSYSFWRAIYPGYRIRYIWGSERDIIGLRTKLRKETTYRYPLHIQPEIIQQIFQDLVIETNLAKTNTKSYGLIFHNCTSSLRSAASKHIPMKKRHLGLIFNTLLPKYLQKLQVLKLAEKERIDQGNRGS